MTFRITALICFLFFGCLSFGMIYNWDLNWNQANTIFNAFMMGT